MEDEPVDMSPEAVCAFYAERDCTAWQKCDAPDVRFFFGDLATCKERSALGCMSRLTGMGSNETPSGVVSCAKALAALSCEAYLDFEGWPDACTVPPGNLPDGTGCVEAAQCQGGACAVPRDQACGVCKTVSREGEACTATSDCLNQMPCVNGACVAHPKLGEACDTKDRFCVTGFTCRNIDAAGLGTCEKPLPDGSPCDPNSPDGDACDATQALMCDSATHSCRAMPDPFGGAGAPCSAAACNAVTFCAADFCQSRPREGELCSIGTRDCVYPAKCVDNVCTLRGAIVCR